jgi:hypothetical protein
VGGKLTVTGLRVLSYLLLEDLLQDGLHTLPTLGLDVEVLSNVVDRGVITRRPSPPRPDPQLLSISRRRPTSRLDRILFRGQVPLLINHNLLEVIKVDRFTATEVAP